MVTTNWIIWALLSAFFAALTAIFAKVGLEKIDPDMATLIRTCVILTFIACFVYFSNKWTNPFHLSRRAVSFLVLSGLATGASWLCYYRALQLGDAAKVAPIDKLSLVLVALFAFAFLQERPSAREWAGILFVVIGVILIALKR
jgi:transporter family protein